MFYTCRRRFHHPSKDPFLWPLNTFDSHGIELEIKNNSFVYIHFKDYLNFCLYTSACTIASFEYVNLKTLFPTSVKQLRGNSVVLLHEFGNCRLQDYCMAAHVQYSYWLSWL